MFLVVVLTTGACSGGADPLSDEGVLQGLDGALATEARPSLEPQPEALIEPPPRNDTERLLRKSRRRSRMCNVLGLIDYIDEPAPHRLDKMVVFAGRYAGIVSAFDPEAKLTDPKSDSGAEIAPPPEVIDAIAVEQMAIFAYQARLNYTKQLVDSDRITSTESAAWMDHAWLQLVNSGFSEAHDRLVAARRRYCP